MAKARFYVEDKVQGVGYRPFIIQKILDSDLEGTARNLPDGRIEVLLEGRKKSILEFVERLKKEKPELAENPSVSDIDFDMRIAIPKVMRSSQALMLGQFGKGVVVLNEINNKLDRLDIIDKKLGKLDMIDKKLDTLPERIAKALKGILKP